MANSKLASKLAQLLRRRNCVVACFLFTVAVCIYVVSVGNNKIPEIPSNSFCRPEDIDQAHLSEDDLPRSYHALSVAAPAEVAKTVNKFLFFVGYPRNGRSILGNILDAHPNIIISRKYSLFKKLLTQPDRHQDRSFMYNSIYKSSLCSHYLGWSNPVHHQENIPHFWQGVHNGSVTVIGDESGDITTALCKLFPNTFIRLFEKLLSVVQVPIYVIHEIQNPYDNIAEMVLNTYQEQLKSYKTKVAAKYPYDNEALLDVKIAEYFLRANAAFQIEKLNVTVVELYEEDFLQQPEQTLSMICATLQVSCDEEYLNSTTRQVLEEPQIMARHFIKWTPHQIKHVQEKVILPYKFFQQYSFDN